MTTEQLLAVARREFGDRDALLSSDGQFLAVSLASYRQAIDVSQLNSSEELEEVLKLMVQAYDREAPKL